MKSEDLRAGRGLLSDPTVARDPSRGLGLRLDETGRVPSAALLGSGYAGGGTKFLSDDGTFKSSGPGAPATTLPSSPSDKQQAVLVDSTSTPTYAWLLQWSSSASAWVFLGGSPLSAEVATSETTASASYADLATAGPSVTVPRAGTYEVSFGCYVNPAASSASLGTVAVKLGAAATSDTDSTSFGNTTWGSGNFTPSGAVSRSIRESGRAASDVLKLQYKSSSGTITFAKRWIKVVPVSLT